MSLLGNKIKDYHDIAGVIGEKVVKHYLYQFKEVNEGQHSINKFVAFICHEDDNEFWKEVLFLSCCDKEWLTNEIGIVMKFPEVGICTIEYSGK